MREEIRDTYKGNVIIGYVDTDGSGNKTARLVNGFIVGFYDKNRNVTMDERHFILGNGDFVVSLVYNGSKK